MIDKAKTVSKELVECCSGNTARDTGRASGRRSAWGRIRTDMERKKNTEGDVLERQKCERRGREIRRDWWERGGEDERKSGE